MTPAWQISLAALLYIVTCMAILFALAAPFVRAAEPKQQSAFIVFGIMQLALFGLVLAETLYHRSHLHRSAGKLLYKVAFVRNVGMSVGLAHVALLVPFAVFEFTFACLVYSGGVELTIAIVHPVFWVVQLTALGFAVRSVLAVVFGIERGDVEIYELGYVSGVKELVTWDTVHSIKPASQPGSLQIAVDGFGGATANVMLRVPEEDRDRVCRLMNDAIRSRQRQS